MLIQAQNAPPNYNRCGKKYNHPDRYRGTRIFPSPSKLYPACCLMNEECYLKDKKAASARRRGLL